MMGAADKNDVIARARDFARTRIAPEAARWSMGESPAQSLLESAAALGLTGLEVPVGLGGLDAGFGIKAQVCEALAEADFGFAMSIVNTHNVAARLCASAGPALRDRHLPALLSGRISACTALTEPGAGSDFAAIRTQARPHQDSWRLTGEKTWIVNARHAGLAIVFAQCGKEGDAAGIGAFLVDLNQQGVRRHAIDSGFSQTSIGTGGFRLDDVNVPAEALLLAPGSAFRTILTEINGARAYVAAMCNGMLRTALDQVRDYGARRVSFGNPLDSYPGWRAPLGQAETELAASRALTARAVDLVASGQDAQLAAAAAKLFAVETCQRALPLLLHAMGAEGLRPEYCFTRHLAAAQVAGLTDGASSILRDRVSRLAPRRQGQD